MVSIYHDGTGRMELWFDFWRFSEKSVGSSAYQINAWMIDRPLIYVTNYLINYCHARLLIDFLIDRVHASSWSVLSNKIINFVFWFWLCGFIFQYEMTWWISRIDCFIIFASQPSIQDEFQGFSTSFQNLVWLIHP